MAQPVLYANPKKAPGLVPFQTTAVVSSSGGGGSGGGGSTDPWLYSQLTNLPGFYLNPAPAGSPFYSRGDSLGNMRAWSKKLMPTFCFLGDSITNFEVGDWNNFNTETYADGWVPQLAAVLAPQGTIKGYGLRGFHNGAPEWVNTGTWTQIAESSAADVAPFGDGWTGTGASAYATWTNGSPPSLPGFDVTMQCIEVTWIDVNSAAAAWSYSVNGGAWVNGPAGGGTNNLIKTTIINTPPAGSVTPAGVLTGSINIPVGGTFAVRCANAAGSSVTAGFTGITPWTTPNGPIAVYTTEDIGLNRVNLGYAGLTLNNPTGGAAFYRPSSSSSSGKHGFDVLDTIQPDLIVLMFRNDYGKTGANVTNWSSGLEALIDYCGTNANWSNGGADFLIWSYWPDAQIVLAPPYAGQLAQAAAFRAATKTIGTQLGVAVLDLYDYCSEELGFTTIAEFENILDPIAQLHPNQYGLNLIAKTLINALGGPVVQPSTASTTSAGADPNFESLRAFA